MKTLFAFLVLLWSGVTWGQSYHKLINEHLYWDVPVADMGYICQGYGDHGPYRYKFSGDTGINEKTYAKIYFGEFISLLTPPSPNCPPFVIDTIFTLLPDVFIREDTVEKKVWRYSTANVPEEILLFDFSVGQGDTIQYPDFGEVIIDFVFTTITCDGVARKTFVFDSPINGGWYMEGIGGAGGLLEVPLYFFEGGTWLECVHDLDENVIWNNNNNNNCYNFNTHVPDYSNSNILNIYPNPASDELVLETGLTNFRIKLFDILGNEVFTSNFVEDISIDISMYHQGIYFLQILQNNSIIESKKIIFTHIN